MGIGIIGAGHIGGTLARKLSSAGHTVRIANARGPDTIRQLADEAGATAVPVADAVRDVDVIIVSIPEKNVPLLPKDLFTGVPEDVVVVDTGNYYPGLRDEPIEAIERGTPESVWVSEQLGRPVVKAFNSIIAHSLAAKGRPAGAAGRIALPVAGDDPRAKKIAVELVLTWLALMASTRDLLGHRGGSSRVLRLIAPTLTLTTSGAPLRRPIELRRLGCVMPPFKRCSSWARAFRWTISSNSIARCSQLCAKADTHQRP